MPDTVVICAPGEGLSIELDVLVISDVICPWCLLGRKRFQQVNAHSFTPALNAHSFTHSQCPLFTHSHAWRLQAADELLTAKGVRSRVQFAPWELAPSLPRAGVSKYDSYLAKFRRSSRDPEVW